MRRTFKYRIFPNKLQERKLERMLDGARSLYNAALEQRITEYRAHRRSIDFCGQCVEAKEARLFDTNLHLLSAQGCQDVLRRLDKAFKAFFRRIKHGETPGFPRFKSKERYNSITFPQYPTGAKLCDNNKRLYIQSVGKVKIRLHQPLLGKVKTVSIIHSSTDRWFVCFSCDDVPAKEYPSATTEVGIDVGLHHFATLSTGEHIENPRWFRRSEQKLATAQRKLSSKKKGSFARRKARKSVARLHEKVRNQRQDFQHKTALKLVRENAFIVVEDLNIRGMNSYSGMNKSILDASWGSFLQMLSYKAEEAGREFRKVPPQGTSQTCSSCGTVVKKDLSERTHKCVECGLVLDRDHNAALNILGLGQSLLVSSSEPLAPQGSPRL